MAEKKKRKAEIVSELTGIIVEPSSLDPQAGSMCSSKSRVETLLEMHRSWVQSYRIKLAGNPQST